MAWVDSDSFFSLNPGMGQQRQAKACADCRRYILRRDSLVRTKRDGKPIMLCRRCAEKAEGASDASRE